MIVDCNTHIGNLDENAGLHLAIIIFNSSEIPSNSVGIIARDVLVRISIAS